MSSTAPRAAPAPYTWRDVRHVPAVDQQSGEFRISLTAATAASARQPQSSSSATALLQYNLVSTPNGDVVLDIIHTFVPKSHRYVGLDKNIQHLSSGYIVAISSSHAPSCYTCTVLNDLSQGPRHCRGALRRRVPLRALAAAACAAHMHLRPRVPRKGGPQEQRHC